MIHFTAWYLFKRGLNRFHIIFKKQIWKIWRVYLIVYSTTHLYFVFGFLYQQNGEGFISNLTYWNFCFQNVKITFSWALYDSSSTCWNEYLFILKGTMDKPQIRPFKACKLMISFSIILYLCFICIVFLKPGSINFFLSWRCFLILMLFFLFNCIMKKGYQCPICVQYLFAKIFLKRFWLFSHFFL